LNQNGAREFQAALLSHQRSNAPAVDRFFSPVVELHELSKYFDETETCYAKPVSMKTVLNCFVIFMLLTLGCGKKEEPKPRSSGASSRSAK
jgi:hypothetical protein